ncbi:MAG: hypothetical protein HQ519_16365 [Planctomycetes bacterium]|nr:hypothetical protein [Planctomycetota bacterium]
MASSSRYGLSATIAPRQKLGLQAALAQGGTESLSVAQGASTTPAQIEARFAEILDAGIQFDASGDGLSAVLNNSEKAFDLAVSIAEAAWPTRVRFALIAAPPGGAAGQDDAIRDKAHRVLKKASKKANFHFELSGKSAAEITLAAALCKLHATLLAEWTESRATAVRCYRRHGKQAEVAQELSVSQQAVSQMLLGARFRELVAAEEAMRQWLTGPKRTTLWPLRNIGTAPATL